MSWGLHKLDKINKSSLLEILFLLCSVFFAFWFYVIPVTNSLGKVVLFSDSAIYGILAQNVLQKGIREVFNLTWAPLYPLLMALIHKLWNIPLEDTGRFVSAYSLVLRIVPTYFLAKYLFNRKIATVSTIILLSGPFIQQGVNPTLAEALESTMIITGLFFSFMALKKERAIWYILAGLTWGLTYLSRLEGWIFLMVLLFFATIKLFLTKQKKLQTIKHIIISLLFFFIITFPYLSFIHKSYGSWTLNARTIISIVSENIPDFGSYQDPILGLTTKAQVFWAGDPHYYVSYLWHAPINDVLQHLLQDWHTKKNFLLVWLELLYKYIPEFTVLTILGLTLTISMIFKKKLSLFIFNILIFICLFLIVDTTFLFLKFLPLIQSYNFFTLPVNLNISLIMAISIVVFLQRSNFLKLMHFYNKNRLSLYLPFSILIGFTPLFFASVQSRYIFWFTSLIAIYSAFFITINTNALNNYLLNKFKGRNLKALINIFSTIFLIVILLFLTKKYFKTELSHMTIIEDTAYKQWKDPGLQILKDHGPGAKIAVYYGGPVFYAQGKLFFFMIDPKLSLNETLDYFENNKVDYLVYNFDSSNLHPLLNPDTKLKKWKMIFVEYKEGDTMPNENLTNVKAVVWKYIR